MDRNLLYRFLRGQPLKAYLSWGKLLDKWLWGREIVMLGTDRATNQRTGELLVDPGGRLLVQQYF